MDKLLLLFFSENAGDASWLQGALISCGLDFQGTIACDEHTIFSSLASADAILSYRPPTSPDTAGLLKKLHAAGHETPFIIVADDMSADALIDAMKAGASDYIRTTHVHKLPTAIVDAVNTFRLNRQRKQNVAKIVANEAMLSHAVHLARLGSWESDLVNKVEKWSDEQYRILWLKPGETEPALVNLIRRVHPEDVGTVTQVISDAIKYHDRQKFECRIMNAEGHVKYVSVEMALKRDENGKLERINGCMLDVSELRIAEQNEKRMMSDLVQRNKDLEQFAYIISHNLRAPVANIVGVSNTLFEGNLEKDEEQEFMGALSVSVKKLDTIITDLNHILQVKRHVNENMETVSFTQLVEEIKQSIGIFLEDQCIMITTDFQVPEMWTLKSYMRSIFYNLISNSIKYRKPDTAPVIEIKSHLQGHKVELTFKDNSIGIDLQQKKDQVFGLYKRFHPEHADGKGMGLFMVKTQVETLGGRISVQSRVNEGAEFKLEFDLRKNNTDN